MSRRNLFPVSVFVPLTLLLAACGGGGSSHIEPPPPPPPSLALTTVVSGLSNPLDLQRPPGDNRFFVVEQRGTIRIQPPHDAVWRRRILPGVARKSEVGAR